MPAPLTPPRSSPEQSLADRVGRLLQDLPPRPAPATLRRRVLAELARRAALPWWRRSFRTWPAAAHVLFILVCGALISASMLVAVRPLSDVAMPSGAGPLQRVAGELVALGQALADLTGSLLRLLPLAWLEAGLAVAVALYLALFGLGAFAWRLLYVPHRQG